MDRRTQFAVRVGFVTVLMALALTFILALGNSELVRSLGLRWYESCEAIASMFVQGDWLPIAAVSIMAVSCTLLLILWSVAVTKVVFRIRVGRARAQDQQQYGHHDGSWGDGPTL